MSEQVKVDLIVKAISEGFNKVQVDTQNTAKAFDSITAAQNRYALAAFQSQAASNQLSAAQKALQQNTDPSKQQELEGAVLKAQVALDKEQMAAMKAASEIQKLGAAAESSKQEVLANSANKADSSLNKEALAAVKASNELLKLNSSTTTATTSTTQFSGATEKGAASLESIAGKFGGLITKLGGLAAVIAGVKKAWEWSQEGAQLNQLTDSFDLMNQSVYQTPDLLNQMRDAVNNTVSDVDLMKSLLTLTAGASDEAGAAYAQAAPQLLEIAKAANKLNPTLGDTSFLFDSLAFGIKRGSPMILDNLGITIKIEEANRKYAESIGKTVTQLTGEEKQMALLNAVMESGAQMIQQVGGSVDSQADSWARLTTFVENSTNSFKQWLADALLPVVDGISQVADAADNEYGTAVQSMIDSNIAAATTQGQMRDVSLQLADSLNTATDGVGRLSGTSDELQGGLQRSVSSMLSFRNTGRDLNSITESMERQLKAVFGESVTLRGGVVELNGAVVGTVTELYTLANTLEQTAAIEAAFSLENDRSREAMEQQQQAIEQRNSLLEAGATYTMAATDALADHTAHVEDLVAEQEKLANYQETFARLGGYIQAATGPLGELADAQADLAEAQGEWIQTTRDNSAEVGEISQQLALDLTDDQKNAYEEILTTVTEGSQEWLDAYSALQSDLTESQRQGLVAQVADLQTAHGERLSIYTGDAQAAEEAQARIDEANAAISQSYRQAAAEIVAAQIAQTYKGDALAAQEAALQTQVALGLISQSQADAMLQVAQNQELVKQVTEELTAVFLADGELTVAESGKIANAISLIESNAGLSAEAIVAMATAGISSTEQLAGSTGNATTEVVSLKDELMAMDGLSVTATANVDTSAAAAAVGALQDALDALRDAGAGSQWGGSGRASGGSVVGGQMYQVGENNRPEFLATPGGLFMIPGDNGRVFNQSQMAQVGGGGMLQVTFSPQISVAGGSDAAGQIKDMMPRMAKEVSQIIAANTRLHRANSGRRT